MRAVFNLAGRLFQSGKHFIAVRTLPSRTNFLDRLQHIADLAKQIRGQKITGGELQNAFDVYFKEREHLAFDYGGTRVGLQVLGDIIFDEDYDRELRLQAMVLASEMGANALPVSSLLELIANTEKDRELVEVARNARAHIEDDYRRELAIRNYVRGAI